MNEDVTQTYSGYKKFGAQSKIVTVEEAVPGDATKP